MFELVVLGSGTCVPSLRRGSPALLVRLEGRRLLLDLGPGALRQLLAAGETIDHLDYVFLSHLHPDHCTDLAAFLFATKYAGFPPRRRPCRVVGSQGLLRFHGSLKAAWGHWIETEQVEFSEISGPGEIPLPEVEPFRVLCCLPDHSPESLAYRLELAGPTAGLGPYEAAGATGSFSEGAGPHRRCRRGAGAATTRSLVYTGDTDYSGRVVDLARGADLLIAECSFPEGHKVEGHLTPALAGRMAREAQVKRLLLTHLYPPADEGDLAAQAAREFSGEILVAEDLMRLEM